MPDDELFQLPEHPFYSCEEDCFLVADGSQMGTVSAVLALEPLLKLMVAEGNIFERRPVKVLEKDGQQVSVECEGGEVVHIDFDALTARKTTPEGEFLYRGGLEDGNDGMGYLRAR